VRDLEVTTLGAILTGGSSTRMGTDKSMVDVGGVTMLDRVSTAMRHVVDDLVLLGPDREGWRCWPDSVHSQGPLAGIATALTRSRHDQVLVVAVDQPFVIDTTLSEIASLGGDVPVVPVDDHGVRQVTCALYPRGVGNQAVEEARAGGSIQTLLDRVSFRPVTPEEWRSWGEDGRSWFSVDDFQALARGEAAFLGG